MRTHGSLVTAALVLAAACSGGSSGPGDPASSGAALIDVRPVDAGVYVFRYYGGIRDARRTVIRGDAKWRATWDEITATVTPRPPLPEVDFSRDEVILAAAGTRSSGGYTIEILSVYEDEGERSAIVLETRPASSCGVTTAITHPLAAVLVPRSAAPVRFVERSALHDCQ